MSRYRVHGKSHDPSYPEYWAWKNMKARCRNTRLEEFPRYGGRGISVCEAWINDFQKFLSDVGKRPSAEHSLDRFPNPDGNYEPGNVRWATLSEQRTNQSITSPRKSPRRKTHCKRGHPYDSANTMLLPEGRRQCRTCHNVLARARNRRYKQRLRESSSPQPPEVGPKTVPSALLRGRKGVA